MKFVISLITLSILFSFESLFAKKVYIPYVGSESWNSIELSYNINRWIGIEFENESRFELDHEKSTKILNTIGISTKPLTFMKMDGLFRVRHKNSVPSIEFLIQETSKFSISNVDFKHRLRFQYKMKDYERIWRNKFEINYEIIDNLTVGLSTESFYYLYSIDFGKFQEMRHEIFLEKGITKNIKVVLGFLYEIEFNIKKPKDARIYNIGLGFSF
jgi:hypothetical protein